MASHWKLFLQLIFLMSLMGFVSHGTQDMYPTFLQRAWKFAPKDRAIITAIGNCGAILGGVLFGHYSDRIGRRKAIIIALALAIVSIPLWAFAPSVPLLMLGSFIMQFMVQGAWGVIPAHINELAPNSVRGFLPGFAYQFGILVAGAVVYIEPLLAESMPYANAMAITAVVVFSGGIFAALVTKERHGWEFNEGT
jgi:SHS family lactate transporter-like MFS transporter